MTKNHLLGATSLLDLSPDLVREIMRFLDFFDLGPASAASRGIRSGCSNLLAGLFECTFPREALHARDRYPGTQVSRQ